MGNRRARRRNAAYDPDQDPELDVIEQGRAAGQRRYWRWVRALGDAIADELRSEVQQALDSGEVDPDDLQEFISEAAWDKTHKTADDALMYYPDCLEVLRFSDQPGAWDDTGGPPGPSEGATNLEGILCVYAREAFALDLLDNVPVDETDFMRRPVKPSADISSRKRRLLRL